MFYDQAEQVLKEGLSVRQGGRQAPLQPAHPARRACTRTKGDVPRAVTEYEAAKKSCDSNKCTDHKEAYFNLGSAYAELEPAAEERGDPAAAVVLEDHLQGRRTRPSTPTSARSRQEIARAAGRLAPVRRLPPEANARGVGEVRAAADVPRTGRLPASGSGRAPARVLQEAGHRHLSASRSAAIP